ncbi:MAG: allophanate hydrolase subunit 1 [Kutzneria sp.]|nr:allophanate hydrolase subunit 1 [Kutzneria sp.]
MKARLLPCGEQGVLLEVDTIEEVLAWHGAVQVAISAGEAAFADVVDVVPAARTLLFVVRDGGSLADVRAALHTLPVPDRPSRTANGDDATIVEVPTRYDGPDLDHVADLTGLTPVEVVRAHTGTPWQVAFCGFAPGFAYLVGGDPRLRVPRRREPRTSVPAGAVGLAGEFSAVYPRSSPGGWQLIGRTEVTVWHTEREPPALMRPGMLVRFAEAG